MKKFVRRRIEKLKTGWYIWLFPLLAVAVTAWMLNDYYRNQGPRIKIFFDDAAGVQAEKTTVRFRGVVIGVVKDVSITPDQKDVVAEVLLRKDAEAFAREGSRFSLITPQVNFQGISGLNTLFEGVYIAVLPGKGDPRHDFKAQTSSATDPLDDTSMYMLQTDNAESVSVGDSITYRGMKIGSVTKMLFDRLAQSVLVQINIENKHARLIRLNTVFWRKAGIHAKLGLFNSEIKINSMDSIMNGGIEIATPEPAAARAKYGHKFGLIPEAPKDYVKWRPSMPYRKAKSKASALAVPANL